MQILSTIDEAKNNLYGYNWFGNKVLHTWFCSPSNNVVSEKPLLEETEISRIRGTFE